MLTLYLMRHGKASKIAVGTADIERGLHKKGKKNSVTIGKRMQLLGNIPELIISSPANRAVETAHVLANEFNYPLQKLILEPSLYGTSSKEAVEMLKKQSGCSVILLIGHNPLLEELAGFLCKAAPKKIPTCGLIAIEFKEEQWSNIAKNQGKLVFTDSPDDNKRENKLLKTAREELGKKLQAKMNAALAEVDSEVLQNMEKTVAKASKKVVKDFVDLLPFDKVAEMVANAEPEPEKPAKTKEKPAEKKASKTQPKKNVSKKESKPNEKSPVKSVSKVPAKPEPQSPAAPKTVAPPKPATKTTPAAAPKTQVNVIKPADKPETTPKPTK